MLDRYFFSKSVCLQTPVFIWGAPRSGTTLLYNLLAKHPVFAFPDKEGEPREGTDFWWRVFGEQRGTMASSLASPKKTTQLKKDYAALLRRQGKKRLLDKIPFMTLWIPLVNEIFPDARHLHIVRDGRAVVNSLLYKLRYSEKEKDRVFREEKLFLGPQPAGLENALEMSQASRHALQWVYLVSEGRRQSTLLGERCLDLRYEELVARPVDTMTAVMNHAGLDYSDAFVAREYAVELESRNHKWMGTRPVDNDGYTARCAIESSEWEDLAVMEPLLRDLGYIGAEERLVPEPEDRSADERGACR